MDHPLGQRLACASGLGDAKTECVAMKEVAQTVSRSNIGKPVGRIGNRPVADAFDSGCRQGRYAPAGCIDLWLESLELIRPELVREVLRNAVQPGSGGLTLVRTQNESSAFLS